MTEGWRSEGGSDHLPVSAALALPVSPVSSACRRSSSSLRMTHFLPSRNQLNSVCSLFTAGCSLLVPRKVRPCGACVRACVRVVCEHAREGYSAHCQVICMADALGCIVAAAFALHPVKPTKAVEMTSSAPGLQEVLQ